MFTKRERSGFLCRYPHISHKNLFTIIIMRMASHAATTAQTTIRAPKGLKIKNREDFEFYKDVFDLVKEEEEEEEDPYLKTMSAVKYSVNGQWVKSNTLKQCAVLNPSEANCELFCFQACSRDECDEAFKGAKEAQKLWRRTALYKRKEILKETARLMRKHWEPIANCLLLECAKTRRDAKKEVMRTADLIEYTAEEGVRFLSRGELITSDAFPGNERDKICQSSRVPVGVVLAIPPFNYPVNLAASKLAPALMSGNAVVVKPPTQGCVAGLLMVQCFQKAGLPKGILQAVTGRGGEIGDYLTQHSYVNMISFTGGDVGLTLAKNVSMIPLQMELGGKDVCVVFPDADLERASKAIVSGGFSYSGQRCTAVKLVVAFEEIADELTKLVCEKMTKLKVGSPEDEDVSITAVISKSSADSIEKLVIDAREKGARLCQEWKRKDNLIWPLYVDNVTKNMDLFFVEPFGPVVPQMRVSSREEAIACVNEQRYGLQGCVFTRDIDNAISFADEMETGTVQINGQPSRGPDHFPFQGVKDSGIGSASTLNSFQLMTKVKTTVINLKEASYTLA